MASAWPSATARRNGGTSRRSWSSCDEDTRDEGRGTSGGGQRPAADGRRETAGLDLTERESFGFVPGRFSLVPHASSTRTPFLTPWAATSHLTGFPAGRVPRAAG